jgi:hypothetical protein
VGGDLVRHDMLPPSVCYLRKHGAWPGGGAAWSRADRGSTGRGVKGVFDPPAPLFTPSHTVLIVEFAVFTIVLTPLTQWPCAGLRTRARSHCRFAPPLIHFTPESLTYSVPLFLKRQCDRTLLRSPWEKDAKLAQKLGQLHPFIAIFPR